MCPNSSTTSSWVQWKFEQVKVGHVCVLLTLEQGNLYLLSGKEWRRINLTMGLPCKGRSVKRSLEMIAVPEAETVSEHIWMWSLRKATKLVGLGGGTVHSPALQIKQMYWQLFIHTGRGWSTEGYDWAYTVQRNGTISPLAAFCCYCYFLESTLLSCLCFLYIVDKCMWLQNLKFH